VDIERRRIRGWASTTSARFRTGRTPRLIDGPLLDITGCKQDEADTGVALSTELGQFGAGGRAMYDPRPGDPPCFDWSGDTP